MKTPNINTIAMVILLVAVALMAYLFGESRNDPSLRIAALVAGTGLVSALAAIASTILTGKDVTKQRDPADMPPGTTTVDTSSVKVEPNPTQPNPKP
ncbi:MAG: hypothetical protein ACLQVL_36805 [Terriglobia bacterium]